MFLHVQPLPIRTDLMLIVRTKLVGIINLCNQTKKLGQKKLKKFTKLIDFLSLKLIGPFNILFLQLCPPPLPPPFSDSCAGVAPPPYSTLHRLSMTFAHLYLAIKFILCRFPAPNR
ncbi:hypothetical protein LguiB_012969 [Lonicera macranthoides]